MPPAPARLSSPHLSADSGRLARTYNGIPEAVMDKRHIPILHSAFCILHSAFPLCGFSLQKKQGSLMDNPAGILYRYCLSAERTPPENGCERAGRAGLAGFVCRFWRATIEQKSGWTL
jgi:hypothetical protein